MSCTEDFYINILGFTLIDEIPINTGTASKNGHDMLNYLLRLPGNENQLCVVTQGLNDKTMFHRYLQKYGSGIHHVAYRTLNIDNCFSQCKKNNIRLTSEKIIDDPIFGVKQFFIDRTYSGVFIEIIERDHKKQIKFTHQNMKKLANTMQEFL